MIYAPIPSDYSLFGMPPRPFVCGDCRTAKPDAPMLRTEVWSSIARPDELLCCRCTTFRLGRPMRLDDLSRCVGNQAILYFLGANGQ